jgi:hypothetical protein
MIGDAGLQSASQIPFTSPMAMAQFVGFGIVSNSHYDRFLVGGEPGVPARLDGRDARPSIWHGR